MVPPVPGGVTVTFHDGDAPRVTDSGLWMTTVTVAGVVTGTSGRVTTTRPSAERVPLSVKMLTPGVTAMGLPSTLASRTRKPLAAKNPDATGGAASSSETLAGAAPTLV